MRLTVSVASHQLTQFHHVILISSSFEVRRGRGRRDKSKLTYYVGVKPLIKYKA